MTTAPHESYGPIGNTLAGYGLAWAHRRAVLAVLLPVLTVALLGILALDLSLGREHTVIIDGFPVVNDAVLPKTVLVAACWLVGLSAAAFTTVNAARGRTVRPWAAVLASVRHLPLFALGLAVLGGGTVLLLGLAAGLGAAGVVAVLAAAAVVTARLMVELVARHFGASGWALTGGRVVSTAGAVLAGGLVVPFAVSMITASPPLPALAVHVIGAVLITGVVAAQAGVLGHVFLTVAGQPGAPVTPEPDPREPDSRRLWITVAVALVAVAAPAAVAAANPFRATTVRSHGGAPGGAVAMVWPAGGHPVIATMSGARFCDDDLCERYVDHTSGPAVMDDRGTAAAGADGTTVVKAVLTGGQDDGGPFIDFAACTRAGCREAWVPSRGSAREPFEWPDLAVAVAPDQAVWFALAASREKTFAVTLIRCADAGCPAPERHRIKDVERLDDDGVTGSRRVRLSIGADGRPELALRTGLMINVVTCDSAACGDPRTRTVFAGDPEAVWSAPAITFEPGALRIEDRMLPLDGAEIASRSGAVASAGSVLYATAAEAAPQPGLHIRIGAAEPAHWRQVLWRCSGETCARQGLGTMAEATGGELLAAAGDGRVLIVREDRILLVSAPG
ncbi:hypothetical protein AB0G04_21830 [Actinoplanes sp. NPDC023801]|uniref:hypothetical protein n=1 Tax=Actinoplanes sp. NPDC023801 TaxID=3154595 RepID=UPI0033CBC652